MWHWDRQDEHVVGCGLDRRGSTHLGNGDSRVDDWPFFN
jgi:hypothetical protein